MSLRHRLAAYAALIRRYASTFAFYWKRRQQLSGPALRAHEAEFLPSALSLQEKPVSPAGRWVARILILLILALITWSIVGKMDIIVNATGKIIPSAYTKSIAAVEVGSVRAIYVQEGQHVNAGERLLELDASMPDAERDRALTENSEARLQMARAQALIRALDGDQPPVLPPLPGITPEQWQQARQHLEGQYRDYRAKLQRIEGDITRYSEALPLAQQQERDYQELAANHDVSLHSLLEKQQARITLEGQLADARNQHAALISETRKLAYDALAEATRLSGTTREDAKRASSHSRLLTLLAPVAGTVQQLNIHTVGSAVPAAQPLMQIVPSNSTLEVEAVLENKDVGFVVEGQSAAVKIDAFEYTKYGTVPAHVSQVSRDAVQDEKRGLIYTTRLALEQTSLNINGRDIPLAPGMAVNVEIKTGTRRVIEYALSPLLQHARESLNER